MIIKTCEDCGKTNAYEDIDPFQYEVRGIEVPCTLCEYCYESIAREI